jgi:hypothetical protein
MGYEPYSHTLFLSYLKLAITSSSEKVISPGVELGRHLQTSQTNLDDLHLKE